jgi:hypothetical protein
MALVTIHSYRTVAGRAAEHFAATEEARQLLQERGYEAFTLQPIAGTDVGGLATGVQFADTRAYTDAIKALQADEGWLDFMARADATGSAQAEEAAVYVDTDQTYVPSPDRVLTVIQTTQWRPNPGRLMGFMENVAQAKGHIERLGGVVRVMNCTIGALPMTAVVSVGFEDLDHWGEYGAKFATDEQFQTYWASVMADPTATMVRSGAYQIVV